MSAPTMPGDLLVRRARLVPLTGQPPTGEPVDLRIRGGRISVIAPALDPKDSPVLDADGAWAIPGLWDQHVHLATWAAARASLSLTGTTGPTEVTRRVAAHLASLPSGSAGSLVQGDGYRLATWGRQPTVAELDAVSPNHPVALISADCHNGWLNSRALALLGLEPRTGPIRENEWFPLLDRIRALHPANTETAYRAAVVDAAARGVVGITDLEFEPGFERWPQRFADGIDLLRVRAATYPDDLDRVIDAGYRTGFRLPQGHGLLTMGPLKIITDGSLNTRTAYCLDPYADPLPGSPDHGVLNVDRRQQTELMRTAHEHGLEVAAHAIGDAACRTAISAFEASGASGSLEHVQLVRPEDITAMAQLGLVAGVQPAHVLDDARLCDRCWPTRGGDCFAFAAMLDAQVRLRLGSDAPVAPLDPWLAMAAAVYRGADDDAPWHQEQAITAPQALAASTDGVVALKPGGRGDITLLDRNPLAVQDNPRESAHHLRSVRARATIVAGRVTHTAG